MVNRLEEDQALSIVKITIYRHWDQISRKERQRYYSDNEGRAKKRENNVQEKQKCQDKKGVPAREPCRKARVEKRKGSKEEEAHYCREVHGKEKKQYFLTETIEKKIKLMFVTQHKIHHTCKTTPLQVEFVTLSIDTWITMGVPTNEESMPSMNLTEMVYDWGFWKYMMYIITKKLGNMSLYN